LQKKKLPPLPTTRSGKKKNPVPAEGANEKKLVGGPLKTLSQKTGIGKKKNPKKHCRIGGNKVEKGYFFFFSARKSEQGSLVFCVRGSEGFLQKNTLCILARTEQIKRNVKAECVPRFPC
jgi:hypothetical protein